MTDIVVLEHVYRKGTFTEMIRHMLDHGLVDKAYYTGMLVEMSKHLDPPASPVGMQVGFYKYGGPLSMREGVVLFLEDGRTLSAMTMMS